MTNKFTLHNHFFKDIKDILCPIEFVKLNRKGEISNIACVFDIEVSSFYNQNKEKQCCMYAWVFGLNGKCIRGRTWDEFYDVLHILQHTYDLSSKKRLVCYVHNLSYEYQFLRKQYGWENVFSLDQREPIYAICTKGIEFRCSYLLSGYSLKNVGENLVKYKVNKMVGDLDYQLIRHSKTPLTEKEWGYILNDGLVVMAFIQEELERVGSIAELPTTKTGYVRKLCKEECLDGVNKFDYRNIMKSLHITPDNYRQLRRTYTGGFTHANARYVGKVMKNVSSFDFTSSYPAVMFSNQMPMSEPRPYIIKDKNDLKYMCEHYCCMFDVRFYNISSKIDFEHYISMARCYECKNYVLDNGRVVEAETLSISVTEKDFMIICKTYKWDAIDIGNFHYMEKGYLPKDLIQTILKLYKDKTTLKGVDGEEVNYQLAKGMLNSCYGMCVTDPCRDEITYDRVDGWVSSKCDIETSITKYNNSLSRFLYYPWGVWITAEARYRLWLGILEFKDDYIYSDTDSLKVLNKDKHMDFINDYNERVIKDIEACLKYYDIPKNQASPKTIKGKSKPLGVWDYEGTYDRFKTLGAKRYMYEENGEMHITIAGVSKQAGLEYLKNKYKTNDNIFKNFIEGLIFPAEYLDKNGEIKNGSGKLCHTYIDFTMSGYVTDYLGNEGYYKELSGVHMEPTSYELSLDDLFIKYLFSIKNREGMFIK